ncbi:MAG: type VI secretion system baseplate subunit TssE [Planctomycetes bacterium]|nr:type VI secretion system baseplate subunit TssE [Planctomycetota bacterium]
MGISESTLFERLREARAARDPSMSLDRARLRRSIAENLRRIFTSRELHAPAQPDYGMPDPNQVLHAWDGGAELMRKKLKSCVEQFEPRLRDVRVLHIESAELGHAIQFTLHAKLASDPPEPIVLDATIAADGRIHVKA